MVEKGTKILSNVVASSVELHQKTGGIVPEVAAREQVRCIIPVIKEAIRETPFRRNLAKRADARRKTYHLSPISYHDIDAIAVTVGPGLIGSLLVGVETAKTLAYVWKKPIVPVNHLQAHLYANWLAIGREGKRVKRREAPRFPAIGLVVSGGHTELVLMKNHGKLRWLGGTRDDAAGECFDKTARLLGFGYPGGPAIEKAARKGNPKAFDLPRPMIKQENFDFSFAGLKTAVVNKVKGREGEKVKKNIADMAASIQQAIVDVLVEKTIRAAEKHKVKSVLVAGGVAANELLHSQLQSSIPKESREASIISHQSSIKLFVPPPKFCTDNATYIAGCAYFNYQPIPWQKIAVNPGLGIAEVSADKI